MGFGLALCWWRTAVRAAGEENETVGHQRWMEGAARGPDVSVGAFQKEGEGASAPISASAKSCTIARATDRGSPLRAACANQPESSIVVSTTVLLLASS